MMNRDESIRTTVFLEKGIYKTLKILAVEQEKTISRCIEEAINDYLKKHKK